MEVAKEILNQLGGNKFIAMTGAKSFVGDNTCLMFSLPSRFAANGINKVRIELAANDTYSVKFYKIRGTSIKPIATIDGVCNDNLRNVFTMHTGLDTSL